jgi:DNA-directed RNA polymerase subunit M/transcription elongation factor TFIIS
MPYDTETEYLDENTPLLKGVEMWCPNCKKLHNVLAYVRLQRRKACGKQTTDICKCPSCRFLFAPMIDLRDLG